MSPVEARHVIQVWATACVPSAIAPAQTSPVAKPSDLELRSLTKPIPRCVGSAQQGGQHAGIRDVTLPGRPCNVQWTLASPCELEPAGLAMPVIAKVVKEAGKKGPRNICCRVAGAGRVPLTGPSSAGYPIARRPDTGIRIRVWI